MCVCVCVYVCVYVCVCVCLFFFSDYYYYFGVDLVVNHFYIALFSALEQTHYVRLNIHRTGGTTALLSCYMAGVT